MRDFTKLEIWQRSHQLTLKIYQLTKTFPREEVFGLSSQMRRAVVSVPTNIAEGCGRDTNSQLRHFCSIAIGSISEVLYQLILSRDLTYISIDSAEELMKEANEIRKMTYAYIQRLK